MVKLLVTRAFGVTAATAAAATFVTRLCTLWFAVAVGAAALVIMQRRARAAPRAATVDAIRSPPSVA